MIKLAHLFGSGCIYSLPLHVQQIKAHQQHSSFTFNTCMMYDQKLTVHGFDKQKLMDIIVVLIPSVEKLLWLDESWYVSMSSS